jgi:molybdopterin-binding protein
VADFPPMNQSTEITRPKQTRRRILFVMTLSARNRLEGKIVELQLGGVMGHVVVKVGSNLIERVITKRSADKMTLKVGDTVSAIIKSTEVMLEKK